MKIDVIFEHEYDIECILKTVDIPCLCKIGNGKGFEIEFLTANPVVTGVVSDWDMKSIDMRSPAGAGGKYIHYSYGQITLSQINATIYKVEKLSFFEESIGWCPIIENGDYAEPRADLWDEEPEWLKDELQ